MSHHASSLFDHDTLLRATLYKQMLKLLQIYG